STSNVNVHSAYISPQRLDGLANSVEHAIRHKAAFDRKVLTSGTGEVVFKLGQLVQIYANNVDSTFRTSRRIIPRWSAPHRVQSR
ncbi:hypothetical protein BV22DRAFT_987640, partial [Leucogyrophana mollusca]